VVEVGLHRGDETVAGDFDSVALSNGTVLGVTDFTTGAGGEGLHPQRTAKINA